MNQKTFWLIFAGIVVAVSVLLLVNASRNPGPVANPEHEQPAQQATVPEDITNPGEVQDKKVTADSFPVEVDDLKLAELLTGQKAIDGITDLHQGMFTVQEGFIANYQGLGGASATVWVSVADSEETAKAQMQQMHQKIGDSPVFTNHQVVPIPPLMYHYVEGMGQEHYFYYRGDDVVWISISDHKYLTAFTGNL